MHPLWLAFSFEQTTIGDIPSVHFRKTFYDVRSDVRHLSSYAARVRGPSSGCRLAFVFVCVCLVSACVCEHVGPALFEWCFSKFGFVYVCVLTSECWTFAWNTGNKRDLIELLTIHCCTSYSSVLRDLYRKFRSWSCRGVGSASRPGAMISFAFGAFLLLGIERLLYQLHRRLCIRLWRQMPSSTAGDSVHPNRWSKLHSIFMRLLIHSEPCK